MPRAIGCNNCKVALILRENDAESTIDESIFRVTHANHMIVIGDLSEFGSFSKYE